ncbi:MAG: DsbA family protein, partial [Steroidobacteraceae bacterium]
MEPQLVHVSSAAPRLELDLIGDLVCPWTFIGKRGLDRALESLYGSPVRLLRWHGLPLEGDRVAAAPVSWHDHFASRLPSGASVAAAERELREAGTDLGIRFAFERLGSLPDTREAHRLVLLAARDGRQSEVLDAVLRAFFERGCDIADSALLGEVAQECA